MCWCPVQRRIRCKECWTDITNNKHELSCHFCMACSQCSFVCYSKLCCCRNMCLLSRGHKSIHQTEKLLYDAYLHGRRLPQGRDKDLLGGADLVQRWPLAEAMQCTTGSRGRREPIRGELRPTEHACHQAKLHSSDAKEKGAMQICWQQATVHMGCCSTSLNSKCKDLRPE